MILKNGGIEMIKSNLLKTLNFTFHPELNEHFLNIGHLVVVLKQDNTLALFDGDYMEIGKVNKKQFISFMNALRNIIEKK